MKHPIETRPALHPATLRTACICAAAVICTLLAVAFVVGWL